jgi:hypothetical protein
VDVGGCYVSDTSYIEEKTHVLLGEGIFIDAASIPELECGSFNYYYIMAVEYYDFYLFILSRLTSFSQCGYVDKF